jgi:hypothetical protein
MAWNAEKPKTAGEKKLPAVDFDRVYPPSLRGCECRKT